MTGDLSSVPGDPAARLVAEWVELAQGDLGTARREYAARENLRAVAFHLQQAIEKLMKAVLRSRGVIPPKTHDLEYLDQLLRERGIEHGISRDDLSTLSDAAVESRYPGEPTSSEDAAFLLSLTETIWSKLRPLV